MKNLLYILAFISSFGFGQDLDPEKVYVYPCIAPYELDDLKEENPRNLNFKRYEILNFEDTIVCYFEESLVVEYGDTLFTLNQYDTESLEAKVDGKPFLIIRNPKDVYLQGIRYDLETEKDGLRVSDGVYIPLTIFEVRKDKKRISFMLKDFPEFCCKYDSEEEFLKLIGE